MPAWANPLISQLKEGRIITFQPLGRSMTGRVESGQFCTVEPVTEETVLEQDDIVLCRIRGDDFFHIIRRIYPDGQFLIGNNVGAVNGKVKRHWIFGKCIGIRDHEPELAALAAGR